MEWAFERIRGAFEKVAEEEAGRLSIIQRIMLKSTDYLRSIIDVVVSVPKLQQFSWKTTCGGFQLARSTAAGGAQSGEKHIIGERPRGCWRCKQATVRQAKVFKAHAVPQGMCENLINALKLLANQQKDGDSQVQSIVAKH